MMWTCIGYVPNDEIISLKPTHPRVTTRAAGADRDGHPGKVNQKGRQESHSLSAPCISEPKGGAGEGKKG